MSISKDDGMRLWNFTETLTWTEPTTQVIGSLETDAPGVEKKIRCSMNSRRSDDIGLHSGTSEPGHFISNYYSLICWTKSIRNLKKDQEAVLSKIGTVRVSSIQKYGFYAFQTEIVVEDIN